MTVYTSYKKVTGDEAEAILNAFKQAFPMPFPIYRAVEIRRGGDMLSVTVSSLRCKMELVTRVEVKKDAHGEIGDTGTLTLKRAYQASGIIGTLSLAHGGKLTRTNQKFLNDGALIGQPWEITISGADVPSMRQTLYDLGADVVPRAHILLGRNFEPKKPTAEALAGYVKDIQKGAPINSAFASLFPKMGL